MSASSPAHELAETPVRDLVLETPARARIFERLGIDYCCGGSQTLGDACKAANRSIGEVTAELKRVASSVAETDWRNAPLADLAQHIIDKHHAFTQAEINRLTNLIVKVVTAHGAHHPELSRLQMIFAGLGEELSEHMRKEETLLFPYIAELEEAVRTGHRLREPMFGTVQNPIAAMTMEHEASAQALEKMREMTNGYAVPIEACASYRALYQALPALAADLHQHIHLENNILFPRAVELEDNFSQHSRR